MSSRPASGNSLRQTLRGSLPGAERVNAALGGVVAAPRVKRSSGCTEGTMRANLPSQQAALIV